MIKIKKYPLFEIICENCHCYLEFQNEDVKEDVTLREGVGTKEGDCDIERYIICPNCKSRVLVSLICRDFRITGDKKSKRDFFRVKWEED